MPLTRMTPFVPCTSLAVQIGFYRDVLGFSVGSQSDSYALLHHDAVAVRLVEVSSSVDLGHPERENSFYVDVLDIDATYDTMKAALDKLPKGRVRAPFNQDYGQREFHVADEDCTLIFFGEALA